jgi:hypothetical protein
MMIIDNKFDIGQGVYLATDDEQLKRLVTSIHVHPNNQIVYYLTCGSSVSEHYDFEITSEVNELIKVK